LQLQREFDLHSNWKTYGLNFQPNKLARLPEESTLRQQLSFQFPYEVAKPLPKIIWQTWKIGIESEKFPKKYQLYQESWSVNNPDYKHYILADEKAHEMIAHLYETVPDVVDAYNSMPKSILKADFFRYLILFARGGVYSDIDTVSLKPVDEWLSANQTVYNKPSNPGLIIGIESDPDRPDWHEWYARRIQFCQWTIQAKKGHPMLRELIAHITDLTLTRKKKGTLKKVLGKDEGGDIMEWTGPGIWTDYVFKYLNNILQPQENFNSKQYEEIITWKEFTGIEVPIVIDDVMVLPITSFSPGVGHMGSKNVDDPLAYVQHIFLGSWKNEKERLP
jgi:alpha 1,6-mannosyltransferase